MISSNLFTNLSGRLYKTYSDDITSIPQKITLLLASLVAIPALLAIKALNYAFSRTRLEINPYAKIYNTPSITDLSSPLAGKVSIKPAGLTLKNCLTFGEEPNHPGFVTSKFKKVVRGRSPSQVVVEINNPLRARERSRVIKALEQSDLKMEVPSATTDSSTELGKPLKAKVRLTESAMETTKLKLTMIKSAEKSIELSGNYAGGAVFDVFLEAIMDRMEEKEDLQTHIIVSEDFLSNRNKRNLKRLQEKFGKRFFALRTQRQFQEDNSTIINHVKALVVDRQFFCVGGTGLVQNLCREGKNMNLSDIFGKGLNLAEKEEHHPHLALSSRDNDQVGMSHEMSDLISRQLFNLIAEWEMKEQIEDLKAQVLANPVKGDEKFTPKSGYKPTEQRYFSISKESWNNDRRCLQVKLKLRDLAKSKMTCVVNDLVHGSQNGAICRGLVKMINNAQKGAQITLANSHFNPDQSVLNALHTAVARGVDVEVIIPEPTHSNLSIFDFQAVNLGQQSIWENGVDNIIKIQQGHSHIKNTPGEVTLRGIPSEELGYMHKKLLIVKQPKESKAVSTMYNGSGNFSKQTSETHSEIGFFTVGKSAVKQALKVIEKDRTDSRLVKGKDLLEDKKDTFLTGNLWYQIARNWFTLLCG
jgi:hypothetical protein